MVLTSGCPALNLHRSGWGRSSVGRAPEWHSGGQGFEPPRLHQSFIMTKDAIKEYLEATPFRPFTVRLTDGRPCEVPARDFAHLAPSGRTLIVFTAGGDGV